MLELSLSPISSKLLYTHLNPTTEQKYAMRHERDESANLKYVWWAKYYRSGRSVVLPSNQQICPFNRGRAMMWNTSTPHVQGLTSMLKPDQRDKVKGNASDISSSYDIHVYFSVLSSAPLPW